MTETREQDRQRDEAGREAIRRLSRPVKGRVMLAQAFTVLSALLSFAPYLALVWLGDLFLAGEGPLAQVDASKVHEIALLLVMAFLSQLFFRALALIVCHVTAGFPESETQVFRVCPKQRPCLPAGSNGRSARTAPA